MKIAPALIRRASALIKEGKPFVFLNPQTGVLAVPRVEWGQWFHGAALTWYSAPRIVPEEVARCKQFPVVFVQTGIIDEDGWWRGGHFLADADFDCVSQLKEEGLIDEEEAFEILAGGLNGALWTINATKPQIILEPHEGFINVLEPIFDEDGFLETLEFVDELELP